MAQHDVYRSGDGSFLLDCQSALLDHLNTRLVIPLLDPAHAPDIVHGLNPAFEIRGQVLVLYTQFAASVPLETLTHRIANLSDDHFTIINALDTLIGVY